MRRPETSSTLSARAHIAGSLSAHQLTSASRWKWRTVPAAPATRSALRQNAPSGGTPFARRWSSQTIAGAIVWPRESIGTSVPRCVVTATPRTAPRSPGWSRQSCWQACGGRVPEGIAVVLEPTRLRRDVAVERDLRLGGEVAVRVEQERANALRAAVDRQEEIVGRGGHVTAASGTGR